MIRETQGTKEVGNNFVERNFFFFRTHFEVGLLHYWIHNPKEVQKVSNREASSPLVKISASSCFMGTCLSSITLSSTRLRIK